MLSTKTTTPSHSILTPTSRLRCLVARAFTVKNLRPADAAQVVSACRRLHGSDFLQTTSCKNLISNSTKRVLTAEYNDEKNVKDLVQLLWFVASPIYGRSDDFFKLSTAWSDSITFDNDFNNDNKSNKSNTNKPSLILSPKVLAPERWKPFDTEFLQLAQHSRSLMHIITTRRQSKGFQHNRTDAIRSLDISHIASAIARGCELRRIHEESLNKNMNNSQKSERQYISTTSSQFFSRDVAIEFTNAWSSTIVKEKGQGKSFHVALLGGARIARCLAEAPQQLSHGRGETSSSSTSSSIRPSSGGDNKVENRNEFFHAIDKFSRAFATRMMRGFRYAKKLDQQQRLVAAKEKDSGKQIFPAISIGFSGSSIFESELPHIANAVVSLFLTSRRWLSYYDFFTLQQLYFLLGRRYRICSKFTQGELRAPMQAIKFAVKTPTSNSSSLSSSLSTKTKKSDNNNDKILQELDNNQEAKKMLALASSKKVSKSHRFILLKRLASWRRDQYAQAAMKNNKTNSGVYLTLQILGRRAEKILSSSGSRSSDEKTKNSSNFKKPKEELSLLVKSISPRWVIQLLPVSAKSEDTAVAMFLSKIHDELRNNNNNNSNNNSNNNAELLKMLHQDNDLILKSLVAHVESWIRFSGNRLLGKNSRFQQQQKTAAISNNNNIIISQQQRQLWGFGKPLRQVLQQLARLLPSYSTTSSGSTASGSKDKIIIAISVQNIVKDVFISSAIERSSAAAPVWSLPFLCDMMRMLRWSVSGNMTSMWLDQHLLNTLLEETDRIARSCLYPSPADTRAAAELVADFIRFRVELVECRSLIELLLKSDFKHLTSIELSMLGSAMHQVSPVGSLQVGRKQLAVNPSAANALRKNSRSGSGSSSLSSSSSSSSSASSNIVPSAASNPSSPLNPLNRELMRRIQLHLQQAHRNKRRENYNNRK